MPQQRFSPQGSNSTVTSSPIKNIGWAYYIVYKDPVDSLFKARNTETGVIDSSNSDSATVIQYALTNAYFHPTNRTVFIRSGTYPLSTAINMVDMHVLVTGERAAESGNAGEAGDTILQANYTGAAGTALINCHNTGYSKQQFANLVIDCNSTVPIGVDGFFITERNPFMQNVGIFNATDTGLLLGKADYCTFYNTVIGNCTNYGLHNPTGLANFINTVYWYGGRITQCGTNVYLEYGNDVSFSQTILEHPQTSCVIHSNTSNFVRYRDCSFEYSKLANLVVIDESGVSNTYDNCRFDSNNTAYTPINVRATARNIEFINNNFQSNNPSTTATIIVTAGAIGTLLMNNTQDTLIPLTIIVTDAGTGTFRMGNSFDPGTIMSPLTIANTAGTTLLNVQANNVINFLSTTTANMQLDNANGTGTGLTIWNANYSFLYRIGTSTTTATRTATLPPLDRDDIFAFAAFPQILTNKQLTDPKITNNSTGAGTPALGANSPATVNTAPYTWLKMLAADGTTVFVPAWK